MKKVYKILWLATGFVLALIMTEIMPVFSIGFWRLAVSSECYIMKNFHGPEGERLLSRIICSSAPEVSLRLLYKVGSSQAQVYAIYGLGLIGSDYSQKYIKEFADSSGNVNLRVGSTCVRLDKKEVSKLLMTFGGVKSRSGGQPEQDNPSQPETKPKGKGPEGHETGP